MSVLAVNSIVPANAGSEDYFFARAWVNFNGTGTVSIRADGGVSSITDNGTGLYTINFSPALVDASYAIALATTALGAGFAANIESNTNGGAATIKTTTGVRINTVSDSNAHVDSQEVNMGLLR